MKAFLLSILAALVLFVPNASAHTYLSETTPQDGATVTESVQQVVLKFEGKIEQGSTFKVIATDGSVSKPATTLVDGVLTGTFDEALPNDTYTVKWDSISQDGHPLSGEFSFTVNAPVAEVAEVEKATTEEAPVEATSTDDNEGAQSPLLFVGAILLGLIFVSAIILIMRKKK